MSEPPDPRSLEQLLDAYERWGQDQARFAVSVNPAAAYGRRWLSDLRHAWAPHILQLHALHDLPAGWDTHVMDHLLRAAKEELERLRVAVLHGPQGSA